MPVINASNNLESNQWRISSIEDEAVVLNIFFLENKIPRKTFNKLCFGAEIFNEQGTVCTYAVPNQEMVDNNLFLTEINYIDTDYIIKFEPELQSGTLYTLRIWSREEGVEGENFSETDYDFIA
jgi:hypothetical protein